MNRIITISRQFGSGGRTTGRRLGEELGIPCYDREIIEKTAENSGFAEEYIREQGEYAESSEFFGAPGSPDQYGHSNRITIWTLQCRIL